jgi:hypothetical protein
MWLLKKPGSISKASPSFSIIKVDKSCTTSSRPSGSASLAFTSFRNSSSCSGDFKSRALISVPYSTTEILTLKSLSRLNSGVNFLHLRGTVETVIKSARYRRWCHPLEISRMRSWYRPGVPLQLISNVKEQLFQFRTEITYSCSACVFKKQSNGLLIRA